MKIFEVTQSINERKKNCGCGQDPCKTYGIQEAGKYADPGGDATQFDRMKRVQQMNRAGVDTSTATTDITRSSYAGIDPEDLQAKKLKDRTKQVQKDIEQREKDKEAEQDRKERQQAYTDKINKDRDDKEDRKKQRGGKSRAEIEREKKHQKRIDKNKGYRKSADGRTLRDPRYYGKNDPLSKKQGAIGKGIDSFVADPLYSVSSYYNDKVDQVKDFLNQRI